MKYLKEIIKAVRDHKPLPSAGVLVRQHARWTQYQKDKDALKNAIPWITFSAMDFLKSNLTDKMKVFEFGGGGSTLFFNNLAGEVVTVEHDKHWFEGLSNKMATDGKARWSGNFVEPEEKTTNRELDPANPDDYYSEDAGFRGHTFFHYATAIDRYSDEYFDLVLIDGRVRPSCLKHSLMKVKKGGWLVLDNSDREYYLRNVKDSMKNFELLSHDFGPTPYVPWFTQTHIWRRIN